VNEIIIRYPEQYSFLLIRNFIPPKRKIWQFSGERVEGQHCGGGVRVLQERERAHGRAACGHSQLRRSPDGRLLVSSGLDNTVRVWETIMGAEVQRLGDPDHLDTLFLGLAWSPDGKWLASGGGSSGRGELFIWEARSGECLYTLSEPNAVVCSNKGDECRIQAKGRFGWKHTWGGASREEHIALFFWTQRCEASGSDMPSDVW
jgi:WD domain, G-beta repeat